MLKINEIEIETSCFNKAHNEERLFIMLSVS